MSLQNNSTSPETVKETESEDFHKPFELAMKKTFEILGDKHPNFINGKNSRSNGGTFADISPGNTDVYVGFFQESTEVDISDAIAAANNAFRSWAKVDPAERIAIFLKAADLIDAQRYNIAALIAIETGKTRFAAVEEADNAISTLRNYSKLISHDPGESKPIGSWGLITPFAASFSCPANLASAAIINGNTVILKPSSNAPFAALLFCNVLHEAGLPAGVLNYIAGRGRSVGPAMSLSRELAAIAFAGSFKKGREIRRWYDIRRFVSVIGGNNAAVVTSNAELKKAAEHILHSAFSFCGQDCSAVKRVYIEESVKDEFTSLLVNKATELKVGDPLSRETDISPLINEAAFDYYAWKMEVAAMDGVILTGGRQLRDVARLLGYYVEPLIVDNLPSEHQFFQEELSYPVLNLSRFDSLEDGIKKADDAKLGTATAIYGPDKQKIPQLVESRQHGIYMVNECLSHMPVGCRFSVFGKFERSSVMPRDNADPTFFSVFRESQ